MKTTKRTFTASDGASLLLRQWLPDEGVKKVGVIHIAHGMAEHSERYGRLASSLTAKGWVVYAPDHRGHANTNEMNKLALGTAGAEIDAIDRIVEDQHEMLLMERKENAQLPSPVLFGHSMGSVIAQITAGRYGSLLSGLILSGPAFRHTGLLRSAMEGLISSLAWWWGGETTLSVIRKISFDQFNKLFAPNRTACDWLSRDPDEVDKYVADPFCGHEMSVGFWKSFILHNNAIEEAGALSAVPRQLPVYVFAGSRDPCHEKEKAFKQITAAFARNGHNMDHAFSTRMYREGRHEMLNEINRDEVTADIENWLDHVFEPLPSAGEKVSAQ